VREGKKQAEPTGLSFEKTQQRKVKREKKKKKGWPEGIEAKGEKNDSPSIRGAASITERGRESFNYWKVSAFTGRGGLSWLLGEAHRDWQY